MGTNALSSLALFMSSALLCASPLKSLEVATSAPLNAEVRFWYRAPEHGMPKRVLLLIPGCNGDGSAMLAETGPWARFADEEQLLLVGPSFKTNLEEVHARQGYYYPELWSGKATLEALAKIRAATGVSEEQALVFGFSAGAHFAHRFALWRPGMVKAFVAYSAGWWDAPTVALAQTPGLILCGEADPRHDASYRFFYEGRRLRLPLLWRGYQGVGHELKPQIIRMAQAFLAFHSKDSGQEERLIGDSQSYRVYPAGSPEAAKVPEESQVLLPSKSVAEAWRNESETP